MHIAYVVPAMGHNGGSRIICDHITYLSQLGHTVKLYLTDVRAPILMRPADVRPVRLRYSLKRYTRHADVIVATHWSTVHTAFEAAAEYGCQCVYFIQGWEPDFFTSQQQRQQVRQTYLLPMRHLTVSHWLQNKLRQEVGVDAVVIPNAIDTSIFYPRADIVRQRQAITCYRDYGALYNYNKTVSVMGQLWKKLEVEAHLFNWLRPKRKPSIRHTFHTQLAENTLAELYSASALYIDVATTHGFGLMPLECMACGTPCIISDSGGINEYARDGENAVILDVFAPDEVYVEAAQRLLDDTAAYTAQQEAGLRTAEQWSTKAMQADITQQLQDFFAKE